MSTGYSAHPVLASEQLQNAEKANNNTNKNTTKTTTQTKTTTAKSQHQQQQHRYSPQHRQNRQNKTTIRNEGETTTSTTIRGFFNFSPFKTKTKINNEEREVAPEKEIMPPTPTRATTPQKTLPDRTRRCNFPNADDDNNDTNYDDDDDDDDDGDDDDDDDTKEDCVDCAAPPFHKSSKTIDQQHETIIRNDQLQHRLNRTTSRHNSLFQSDMMLENSKSASTAAAVIVKTNNNKQQQQLPTFSDGCPSGLSSAISSPSASTVSSPLSTPTRLTSQLQHSHQHCCRKSSISLTPGAQHSTQHHHHHMHQHHHSHQHTHHHHLASSTAAAASSSSSSAAAAANGCKKLQKFDPRFGPSPYRQLLPILLCILSFATVFTILIIYMDTTEIRHQQFRLNMSRDYDLYGVAQDDPDLVTFLREIHMRKYSTHFLKNRGDPTTSIAAASVGSASVLSTASTGALNFSAHHDELVPKMAHHVAELVGGKVNGAVIQSLTGALGHLMTAPWLAETLNWAGIIVEPEPRRYFNLRKQNMQRAHMQVVHACVSPNPYPKEVTIHNEESEVRINSLLDAESSWFNSRVKCFPLYTIMLACNRVEYDLLSLGVHGHELEILQTLPFDKIKIEVISIHLQDNFDKMPRSYIQTITKFLMGKSYKLQKNFGSNYFYQRINTTNRTRKKDILLLKTP